MYAFDAAAIVIPLLIDTVPDVVHKFEFAAEPLPIKSS
jgi:hypothetical protein